jgi:hypothetical protein
VGKAAKPLGFPPLFLSLMTHLCSRFEAPNKCSTALSVLYLKRLLPCPGESLQSPIATQQDLNFQNDDGGNEILSGCS